MSAALAVDIGGTFTDAALECARGRFTRKVLTTPQAPEAGFIAAAQAVLAAAGVRPGELGLLVHGTTLLTNALLERRGARIAFLTTEGHRDTLEIGLESRFHLYDLEIDKPRPLVPRALRFPVRERMDAAGNALLPLAEIDVVRISEKLKSENIESLAIGFLHSYANPAHERRAAGILRERLPGVHLTLSAELSPEMREFDRFSTACANAYVKPVASAYIGRLEARLKALGVTAPLFLMHSGGGMLTPGIAREQPIRLLESGPAGGALFASATARALGLGEALCFDMGGTTAKLSMVGPQGPATAREFELDRVYRFLKGSGLPVRIPVIEMVEIGAGGGSIAHVDRMKRLQVGPQSAGAVPGPACYGRGGAEPTVTDADLALGRIDPEQFGDGAVRPSKDMAIAALKANVAEKIGVGVERAAAGICQIVDERMANAARAHVQESARELSRQTLVAFGGAGPLHAGELAQRLGIDTIVVPAGAGVGSAIGFLRAPVSFEIVRSLPMRLSAFDAGRVAAMLAEVRAAAIEVVAKAARPEAIRVRVAAFMRYVGQGHELEVAFEEDGEERGRDPDSTMHKEGPDPYCVLKNFEGAYVARYGQTLGNLEVEVLGWRVTAAAPAAASHGFDDAPAKDGILRGPMVIAQPETTIYVPEGFTARVVAGGHVVMKRD